MYLQDVLFVPVVLLADGERGEGGLRLRHDLGLEVGGLLEEEAEALVHHQGQDGQQGGHGQAVDHPLGQHQLAGVQS